jgi:hypothetical protein
VRRGADAERYGLQGMIIIIIKLNKLQATDDAAVLLDPTCQLQQLLRLFSKIYCNMQLLQIRW